jgi:hypothetical protein
MAERDWASRTGAEKGVSLPSRLRYAQALRRKEVAWMRAVPSVRLVAVTQG